MVYRCVDHSPAKLGSLLGIDRVQYTLGTPGGRCIGKVFSKSVKHVAPVLACIHCGLWAKETMEMNICCARVGGFFGALLAAATAPGSGGVRLHGDVRCCRSAGATIQHGEKRGFFIFCKATSLSSPRTFIW